MNNIGSKHHASGLQREGQSCENQSSLVAIQDRDREPSDKVEQGDVMFQTEANTADKYAGV